MNRLAIPIALLLLALAGLTACHGPQDAAGLPAAHAQPLPTAAPVEPAPTAQPATPPSATPSLPPAAVATVAVSMPSPVPTEAPAVTPVPATSPPAAPSPTPDGTPKPPAGAGQNAAVPVSMYHYVRPDPGPRDPAGQDLSVTPEDFAAEMQYLDEQGYTTMTLAELQDVREGKAALPANPIVLTFDDGYRDFYTAAWPVLKLHHFKATIFIITGVVGTDRYLTWDMIRELDASGQIEIGSHTVDHPELPSLSDARSHDEIFNSKQTLEARIGHPVVSFSYPAGHYNQREVGYVRQAGYRCAVTTRGAFSRAGDPSLELPRFRIHGPRGLSQIKANL